MFEQKLMLNSIESVKEFSSAMSRCEADCDLLAENHKYVVDAKSIMGIFSLDLSKPVTLRAHGEIDKGTMELITKFFV